eukprot:gene17867-19648_t
MVCNADEDISTEDALKENPSLEQVGKENSDQPQFESIEQANASPKNVDTDLKEDTASHQNLENDKEAEKVAKVDNDLQEIKKREEKSFMLEPDLKLEVEDEENTFCEILPSAKVVLDSRSADLHFVVTPDGVIGRNLVKNGFSFIWCGVQANYGVTSGRLLRNLDVQLPDNESLKHGLRIGWSAESSGLQLGEASLSYGYESSGKICTSSNFSDYADPFGEGDIIGAFIDLESEPKSVKYTKNGQDLGIAMSLSVNLCGKALFPHLFIKNMEVEVNFGAREAPWYDVLDGYTFIQDTGIDNLQPRLAPPVSKADCEVIMMVGLPASGKTTWAQSHCRDHPDKDYYQIGSQLVFDRMKIQGEERKINYGTSQQHVEAAQRIVAKFLALSPLRNRNYILDQTNLVEKVRQVKMENFKDFQRKAVVVIPTFENQRRQMNEKKHGNGIDVPFDVLASMKYFFTLPSEGEYVDSVEFIGQDVTNAQKTLNGYRREGKRVLERGSDDFQHKRRYDHDHRGPKHESGHYGGRHYEDARRYHRRDQNHRGSNFRNDYYGRSYNSGTYGSNSYSYGGGYGGGSYSNSSYGQRNRGYGNSYSGQRGMYDGGSYGSYGGGYSNQPASGYRQSNDRGRYRGTNGRQYSQNQSQGSRASQSGAYGRADRSFVPRGGGWSQGYSGQQSYNNYQSGQNNFRGYGY